MSDKDDDDNDGCSMRGTTQQPRGKKLYLLYLAYLVREVEAKCVYIERERESMPLPGVYSYFRVYVCALSGMLLYRLDRRRTIC